jgi:hypothetical protein
VIRSTGSIDEPRPSDVLRPVIEADVLVLDDQAEKTSGRSRRR